MLFLCRIKLKNTATGFLSIAVGIVIFYTQLHRVLDLFNSTGANCLLFPTSLIYSVNP